MTGGHNAALSYDPLGRLWQVTSGSNATRFLYDDDALVAEYDAAGNMLHRYAHWEGADVPMIAYNGSTLGDPRHLLSDHEGSIVTLSDAAGNVVALNSYDEYGIPGAGNQGRFQYTGQLWLGEIGMYYYKARIYSPTLGRFLQTDPIGYDDQYNLYAYVRDDPVNHGDPSGECCYETTDPKTDQTQRMTQGTLQFNQEHPTAAVALAVIGGAIMTGGTAAVVLPEVMGGAAIAGGGAGATAAAEVPAAVESAVPRAAQSLEAPAAPRPAPRITAEVPGPGGPRTIRIPGEPIRTTPHTESRGGMPTAPARTPAGTNPSGAGHVTFEVIRAILRLWLGV